MVKFFNQRNTFEHKWEAVTLAVFKKYPNPFSKHVITADLLQRDIDDSSGCLYTKRLLQKIGNMPSWLSRLLPSSSGINNVAFVIEESFVDPIRGLMTVCSRNISHRGWMSIEESQTFTRDKTGFREWTLVDVQVKVVCGQKAMSLGRLLTSKIEGFSINRLKEQLTKSRQALLYILEKHANV